jgi:protein gp37
MKKCPQHVFQILTKRPERMLELSSELDWPPQVWAGTSVENDDYSWRIDELRNVPAEIRFLSLEPLIGPIEGPNFGNIDWIIVGGESGPKARPMDLDWVLDIFEACRDQDVPFFFKQWGAYGPDGKKRSKKKNGRELKGETWDEMPSNLSKVRFANKQV